MFYIDWDGLLRAIAYTRGGLYNSGMYFTCDTCLFSCTPLFISFGHHDGYDFLSVSYKMGGLGLFICLYGFGLFSYRTGPLAWGFLLSFYTGLRGWAFLRIFHLLLSGHTIPLRFFFTLFVWGRVFYLFIWSLFYYYLRGGRGDTN